MLFFQATNSQTTFPQLFEAPESSPAPSPSLTTTTSKRLTTEEEEAPQTSTELSQTTSEFAPTTEAFPRLNCGGRGFYQVGGFQDF